VWPRLTPDAAPQARSTALDLFAPPDSLRWPTERRALWLTLLFAPLTIGLIDLILPEHFSVQQVATLAVGAMLYVTIARGRLLGTSVRVHRAQLPRVAAIVERCAAMLDVPLPHVFVREDPQVCITSAGLGFPYAVVLSSRWLPLLDDDELQFLVGSELAHIAAGHTRISSLFSASGKENPMVAIVVGAWLRRTEYTADRIGLLCCGSLEAAIRAIFKCSFHQVSDEVDYRAFTDQRRELAVDPTLRMGEWLGESPYAVNRLRELGRFVESPLYSHWRPTFERRSEAAAAGAATLPLPAPDRRAGFFQRSWAIFADLVVISLITSGVVDVEQKVHTNDIGAGAPAMLHPTALYTAVDGWLKAHHISVSFNLSDYATWFYFCVYSAVLVAFAGRTFGMMLMGLHVTRNDAARVSIMRSAWRYTLAFLSMLTILPILWGVFTGRYLHDRWSGTKVVHGGA